jgi:hypothetical protein
MSNLSNNKIILYIFKISIGDKSYISSSYDYFQYKIKIINRIKNTNRYSKIAEYIKNNDIEDTDIHISVIMKKEIQKKNKEYKIKITNEFINLYDSIYNGFNKPTKSIQQISQDYYNQYKSKILKQRDTDYNKIKSKQYYHDNKEFILKKNKEKVQCRCGSWVCRVQMRRHVLTKKHEFLMNIKTKN